MECVLWELDKRQILIILFWNPEKFWPQKVKNRNHLSLSLLFVISLERILTERFKGKKILRKKNFSHHFFFLIFCSIFFLFFFIQAPCNVEGLRLDSSAAFLVDILQIFFFDILLKFFFLRFCIQQSLEFVEGVSHKPSLIKKRDLASVKREKCKSYFVAHFAVETFFFNFAGICRTNV